MKRRDFVRTLTIGGIGVAVSPLGEMYGQQPKETPPNILVILGDDHNWYDIGCYGSEQAHTPNMDRLAEEGMRFTHAFTATAMCAPTRQQFYTGLFPVRSGAFPNHSQVKPGTRSVVHYLKDLGYRVGLAGKRHFGPADSFPFEMVSKGQVDFDAIREFVNRDPEQPYCLMVTPHNSHVPWDQGDPSQYPPEALELPPNHVDTPETRKARSRYLAEVTALDDQVGRCQEIVADSGQKENTLFIFTSEQGSQFPFHKWTCYDGGLRVGFLARWPARIPAGEVTNAMVQYVDMTPTLVDAAGGDPPAGLDGKSFLPVLSGESDEHHQVVYGVHTTRGIFDGTDCYPVRSIRTKTHKYIMNLNHRATFRNVLITKDGANYWRSWERKAESDPRAARLVHKYQHRPPEEFYHVAEDPYEMENLADEPEHEAAMDVLRAQLTAWMAQQGDLGIETELQAPKR